MMSTAWLSATVFEENHPLPTGTSLIEAQPM
jgi:hypothetical protein